MNREEKAKQLFPNEMEPVVWWRREGGTAGGVCWSSGGCTAPLSCLVLHQQCLGGGIAAAGGTLSCHSSHLTHPRMSVLVLAVRLTAAELISCASPKQHPSYMGHQKAKVWAPAQTFLSVWPCRTPWKPAGFSQLSASSL